MTTDQALSPTGLPDRILALVHALREAGVPVAISDSIDAQRAAAAIDLLDRDQVREALAATLIATPGHRVAFDTLFDLYFPAKPGTVPGEGTSEPRDVGDLLAELVDRVLAGDDAAIRRLAHEAVEGLGRVETREGEPAYYSYRVFSQINLAGVMRRLLGMVEPDDALAERLLRDEFDVRLRRFREEVDAEIRRRTAARRGADDVARTLVRQLPEEIDFFRVGAEEQAVMRRAVRPLARRLATRLAVKRRRARAGRLDARRTMRRALSTGGVPIDPAFRTKKVHRPELVLLCDVSSSVAAFARFTLMFVHALQGQFSKVRSFAFIDTVDEVTRLFAEGDFTEAMRRISSEAKVVWLDGHSDYGNALETFHAGYLDAVTPRTTVLLLGDARNNYRASNSWVLAELRRRARHVHWLNPEPRRQWGGGDSIAPEYARYVDSMVECRNLKQLAAFVESLG